MKEKYLLQLMLSKGIGDAAIKKILNYTSLHPEDSLESLCNSPEKLASIIKCHAETVQSVKENKELAEKTYLELTQKKVVILFQDDARYPVQLKDALGNQCPPVLFVKGNIDLLYTEAVGFCGSRKVSEKGLTITSQCAEQLVQQNVTVVSGYAAGTDLSAHTSAMIHGGNTVFVLAEGILRFSEKKAVKNHITEKNHVFVSQFLPYALWSAGNAMRRNSIIIGLSKAMILVESGKTGGTFAAGEETLKRELPLFVIDYAKPEVSAEANPYFIERGGQPIRGKNGIPNLEKVFSAIEGVIYKKNNPEQLKLGF